MIRSTTMMSLHQAPRSRPRMPLAIALMLGCLAAPSRADTFKIEIDYMVGAGHSHMPSTTVINAVVQMFACQGHTLIIEVDDVLPHYQVLQAPPEDCNGPPWGDFFAYAGETASFGALKALFFDHSHADGWHYCIFAHQYESYDGGLGQCVPSGSSGLAEVPGWNFIVSLGGFVNGVGTEFDRAATLAHEFGHNLGLSHCTTANCEDDPDDPSWTGPLMPNLASVMSYRYQLAGVRANMLFRHLAPEQALLKNIDYSQGRMCPLNENSLDEFLGTDMTWNDWNCSG